MVQIEFNFESLEVLVASADEGELVEVDAGLLEGLLLELRAWRRQRSEWEQRLRAQTAISESYRRLAEAHERSARMALAGAEASATILEAMVEATSGEMLKELPQ